MDDKFILMQLTIAQKEVNKRLKFTNETGIDLANYENGFYSIFENLIVEHFSNVDKKQILIEIGYWLWEQNYNIWFKEKPKWIKSKFDKKVDDSGQTIKGFKVNLKKPKDFLKYLQNY